MLGKLYNSFSAMINRHDAELELAVGSCKTLLDVGCGSDSSIKLFSHKLSSVGIDAFMPSIEKSRKAKIHNSYKQMDALDIGKAFRESSFDCVIALDVIEHLDKKDSFRLIE